MAATTGTPAQQLAARLLQIRQAQVRAANALTKINEAAEVVRAQTTLLREALYTIERNNDKAHLILDGIETNMGLVDEDGKRFDEVD